MIRHDALGIMLKEYLKLPEYLTQAVVTIKAGEPTRVDFEYLTGPVPHVDKNGDIEMSAATLLLPHDYEPDARKEMPWALYM